MVARLHGESRRTWDCFSYKGGSLQGDFDQERCPHLERWVSGWRWGAFRVVGRTQNTRSPWRWQMITHKLYLLSRSALVLGSYGMKTILWLSNCRPPVPSLHWSVRCSYSVFTPPACSASLHPFSFLSLVALAGLATRSTINFTS